MVKPNLSQMQYKFKIPKLYQDCSELTNSAIQIGSLASRLAQEKRTMVFNPDGRPENVSEHSHMVAMVAEALAEQYFTHLDSTKVASYGIVHDIVEAYIGDVPTHIITDQGLLDKSALEGYGLKQLKKEYAHLPKFVNRIQKYEEQKEPEARYVRIVDKLMPLLIHVFDSGEGLVLHKHGPSVIKNNAKERAESWLKEYPELFELIDCRNELAEIVIKIIEPRFKN